MQAHGNGGRGVGAGLCNHTSRVPAARLRLDLVSFGGRRRVTGGSGKERAMYAFCQSLTSISVYLLPALLLSTRGGGLGSRPIFKKFHETYAPS